MSETRRMAPGLSRAELQDRLALLTQQTILEILRDQGPTTARDLRTELEARRPDLRTAHGIAGWAMSGHLRELHRDGLVERTEPEVGRDGMRSRWRLVEERCAGLVEW